jgi:pteridine reductase
MTLSLAGQAVLITGGARRVGAAICRRLHREGANLMLHYRASSADAERLRDEFVAVRSGSCALVQADLLNTRALPALVEETVARFGRLDVLINNAASFFPTPVGRITERAWDDLVGTILKAPLFLSQAAAPQLRQQRGAIVNIVDIHAERPMKDYVVYSTAKGGLAALTRSLARELGPEVRVNGVAPGAIAWPEDPAWSNNTERTRILAQTSLNRIGDPDDVARAVQFLIADAPYVTGQIIAVDGGRSISL